MSLSRPAKLRAFATMSHMLPFEVLQIQAQVLELFASLYPSEDELRMSDETRQAMKHLQDGTDATNAALVNISSLDFTLDLELQDDKDSATERSFPIRIGVQLPVRHSSSTTPLLTLHQPPWLTRAAHDTLSKQLSTALPQDEQGVEILLDYLDKLKEAAPEYFPKVKEVVSEVDTDEEFRVWLTLTSLSTREKRDDMVNWAPDFNLTGFVLAGKPALLVLEGTTRSVDAFMSDIKARSWVKSSESSQGQMQRQS